MQNINIENPKYQSNVYTGQNEAVEAIIDGVWHSVPLDPANRHYAEIMRQVEAGELVIQDADTPEE